MKEKIYTIPVSEAFDAPGECAFCVLEKKMEQELLDYVLGPSYMEEDIRATMDKEGFCRTHYHKLFHGGNHLGVALMLQTYLKKQEKELEKLSGKELSAVGKKGLFSKGGESPVGAYQKEQDDSCYICSRVEERMERYLDTFFLLWKTEPEFRSKVLGCKGFCLPHLGKLTETAGEKLKGDAHREFLEAILPMQKQNMTRLSEELEWFVQKFDYRYQNEPWKNSRDAVERVIQKVSSEQVSEGKEKP